MRILKMITASYNWKEKKWWTEVHKMEIVKFVIKMMKTVSKKRTEKV